MALQVRTKIYTGEVPARKGPKVRQPNEYDITIEKMLDDGKRRLFACEGTVEEKQKELITPLRNACKFVSQDTKGLNIWIVEEGVIAEVRDKITRQRKSA